MRRIANLMIRMSTCCANAVAKETKIGMAAAIDGKLDYFPGSLGTPSAQDDAEGCAQIVPCPFGITVLGDTGS